MNDMPLELILEKNKLSSVGTWTLLLELIPLDETVDNEYYVKDTQSHDYDGQTYAAAAFDIDTSKSNADGELPTTELTVYDTNRALRLTLEDNDGGVGWAVKMTPFNTSLPSLDYSTLTQEYVVITTTDDAQGIVFSLGGPVRLRTRVPPDSYFGNYCRHHYGREVDGLIGCDHCTWSISGFVFSSTDPVKVTVTSHPWSTGDSVTIYSNSSYSPSLDTTFTATKVDADTISLDGTDSSDYVGSYPGGGQVYFAGCKRILSDCRLRGNSARSGGFHGIRSNTVRFVA